MAGASMAERVDAEVQPERTTFTVSLPRDVLEEFDEFVRRHGLALGYRNRVDFMLTAMRNQRDADVQRLLRLQSLDEGTELEWPEPSRRR